MNYCLGTKFVPYKNFWCKWPKNQTIVEEQKLCKMAKDTSGGSNNFKEYNEKSNNFNFILR